MNIEVNSHQNGAQTETSTSFEEAMRELEEIVASLENGSASLDESIALVKRGQELATLCEKTLQQAELTISTLIATDEGELVEQEVRWQD